MRRDGHTPDFETDDYFDDEFIVGTIGSVVWAFNGEYLVLVHQNSKMLFDSKTKSVVR